ncbi:MAG: TldD/PmbA family protein [Armatimonadetes bacterium]|nr:TldD/PmbA family protein [Armatimonadota bacterium]
MHEITEAALARAQEAGASYADIRVIRRQHEGIQVKNGKVESLAGEEEYGFGVRVIADGAWGFASSFQADREEAERVAEIAVRIARASARWKQEDVALAPEPAATGVFESPLEKDPFEVPLEEKISLLLDADRILRQRPEVKVAEAEMNFFRDHILFASSEGACIEQIKIESGAGVSATAVEGEEVQRRSYPCSFGGDYATAGYEFVENWDLPANAEWVAKEAVELLHAPQCPPDTLDLILEGSILALQVHESCGHPIELDRVFGTEASYAGTSFLTTDKLGSFQYGSEQVNIVADATIPHGLGSFFYDDEGVVAQRVQIVSEGLFTGYLSSRETAARLGLERSGGAMRADGWNRLPIIRMTNINLEPGDWTLDDIIGETKRGMLMQDIVSWSIDDKRLNFQFGCEVAREITDGSLGKIYKNPTYTGITYEFWGGCDAIASEDEWRLWGIPNCGKGEPGQAAHVGHGVSAARFRNVRVGLMEEQA